MSNPTAETKSKKPKSSKSNSDLILEQEISESPLVPKKPKEEYECIRCGYHTQYKSCMRTHLYKNKKPCPGIRNPIPMTDSMREEILKNKKYEIRVVDNPNPIINEFQNWFFNYT